MRVLQLGPYPPPHGGVQSNLVAIHKFLEKRGIRDTVINITRHRKPASDRIYYPKNAFELLGLLFRLRYDIIHLHIGGMLTRRLLYLGLVCTLRPACKSVLTFHSGGYPSTPAGKSTRPSSFVGFVLRRFDRVVGVNPEIIQFLHKLGIGSNRARLIPPYAFLPDAELANGLPDPLNTFLVRHKPILISVGLLEPEYDLTLQIEVLGKVLETFHSAGLVIIGSGSLKQDLRRKIEVQSYADDVLLCGDIPHAFTMAAIARSDVMLRTTFYDGDAISVREALHLGTAVIATDNGMRPGGVHLIPRSDVQALFRAIEQILATPRTTNHERTVPDESNLQSVLELYEELLGK